MKEMGREHAGVTFVVVYSPPPSTQVMTVQIDVNFKGAGSIEAVAVQRTDRGRFQTSLVCMRCTFQ